MTETYEKGTVQSQREKLDKEKLGEALLITGYGMDRRNNNIEYVKNCVLRGENINDIWKHVRRFLKYSTLQEYYQIAYEELNNGSK